MKSQKRALEVLMAEHSWDNPFVAPSHDGRMMIEEFRIRDVSALSDEGLLMPDLPEPAYKVGNQVNSNACWRVDDNAGDKTILVDNYKDGSFSIEVDDLSITMTREELMRLALACYAAATYEAGN